jgi:hypothetical protein
LSKSNKTARSVTLVGDSTPANASISICVSGLSRDPSLELEEVAKLVKSVYKEVGRRKGSELGGAILLCVISKDDRRLGCGDCYFKP